MTRYVSKGAEKWQLNRAFSTFPAALRWAALIAGMGLVGYITYASMVPVVEMPHVTHFDKILHFLGYGAMGALLLPGLPRFRAIWVVLGLIVLGIGIEIAQASAGLGRTGSWGDVLANSGGAIGAYIGWTALFFVFERLRGQPRTVET